MACTTQHSLISIGSVYNFIFFVNFNHTRNSELRLTVAEIALYIYVMVLKTGLFNP